MGGAAETTAMSTHIPCCTIMGARNLQISVHNDLADKIKFQKGNKKTKKQKKETNKTKKQKRKKEGTQKRDSKNTKK